MKSLCAMATKYRATATQAGLKGQENFDKNGDVKLTREEFADLAAR